MCGSTSGSLKESIDRYSSQNRRRTQEARERAELLGRAGTHGLLGFGSRSEERQGLGMAVAISICGFGLRLFAIMQCKVNRGLVQDAHHLAIPARDNPPN
ncbi:hypothetical protein RHMOL_Rhmol02G0247100 [Rhododendron molle]|uniref:Uncharacterized protein n=1 Tax=Rhododendron molle TaxID=49168 RepID=A0ACC0PTW7_RHOML|nr:hypothetical protein RHMOL_Rhmol02G0247100 [Rhododendron molle]